MGFIILFYSLKTWGDQMDWIGKSLMEILCNVFVCVCASTVIMFSLSPSTSTYTYIYISNYFSIKVGKVI